MPDLFITFHHIGDIASRNYLHAVYAAFAVDTSRFQIAAGGKNLNPLLQKFTSPQVGRDDLCPRCQG
jgi:hypothetical protein